MSTPRMFIQIDLNNVEAATYEYKQHGVVLNYSSLIDEVSRGYDAYVRFYDGESVSPGPLRTFHQRIRDAGYDLVLKTPSVYTRRTGGTGMVQKEVDTSIVKDAVKSAALGDYDVFVFVSGDRDIVPAVEAVKEMGHGAVAVSFRDCMSREMRDLCDEHVVIEETSALELLPYTHSGASRPNRVLPLAGVGE